MNYDEVLLSARSKVGPYCKACPVCNGRACGNSMPGPGCKYPGNAAARNYDKWQDICVNMDTLCPNSTPDISFSLFGHSFSAPIFVAPLGSLDMHYGPLYEDKAYNRIMLKAAADYGIIGFTGDGVDPSIMQDAADVMTELGGIGVPTIKPWNKEFLYEKFDYLRQKEVFAIAVDIDGAGLPFLKKMNPNAGSKSVSDMKEIIAYSGKKFILKGIMTAKGAEKAVEAGASAIVVSNHGGRVQGGVPSTAEVLPEIVSAVKGDIHILVDGGIRSGVDVFRAIALGAEGVLIGRPVLTAIYGGGQDGFNVYMDKLTGELRSTMQMCGAANLSGILREMVR